MSIFTSILAEGPGWSVRDVRCDAGPDDRPYEEEHAGFCIAAVTGGSFQYRTVTGRALMAPGALLLGEPGACFECGHEHARGDRCIAFAYEPGTIDAIAAAIPRLRELGFGLPRLPPLPATGRVLAELETETGKIEPGRWDEIAVDLAGTVLSLVAGVPEPHLARPSDERRITTALRRIEAEPDDVLPLAALAREAAMSPFHFLRRFRDIVGLTPHQYLLRTRLHRAAVAIRRTTAPISEIAYTNGFGDLSTFNRRFRRVYGVPPGIFRRGGGNAADRIDRRSQCRPG